MSLPSWASPGANTRTQPLVRPALIGRVHEQGLLHDWLEAACAGQGRCVLISGEAGIGKNEPGR